MKLNYPSHAEIDLNKFHANVDLISATAKVPLLPVIKANAYGHGMLQVAGELIERKEIEALCVGTFEEAKQLRASGVKNRIIVLDGVVKERAGEISDLDLESVVSSAEDAKALANKAGKGKTVKVHLNFNTGMGRLGAAPSDAIEVYKKLARMKKVALVSVKTHFADSPNRGGYTRKQIDIFDDVLGAIRSAGHTLPPIHAANTAGIFLHPKSRYDLVRPGIGLYGIQEFVGPDVGLKPILTWRARVMHVRKVAKGESVSYGMSWTSPGNKMAALCGVGYADGYSRALSNRAHAIIGGKKIRQIGVICMDNCLFDITNTEVKTGDMITLIGSNGSQEIKAIDMAKKAGTIAYEILCGIGQRAPRLYMRSGKLDRSLTGTLA